MRDISPSTHTPSEGRTLQKEELPIVLDAQTFFSISGLAHMTHVIGSIHLDLKSVWIIELEGFF
jgi:hypothetical protein